MPGMSASGTPSSGEHAGVWIDICALDDLEPGRGRRVAVGQAHAAVFRAPDDRVHALADSCPHAGAPLSAGALRDGVVVCTWHGWRFDPATGQCANVTWSEPVATYEVRVEAGRVLLRAPRAASR